MSLTRRGIALLLWISLSRCYSQAVRFQGKPPDATLVSNIINDVQPYLQTLRAEQDPIHKRSYDENVEDAIDAKIKELMPLLQDNKTVENTEDNLQQEGDETTIIEFITNNNPKDSAITMRGSNHSESQPNITMGIYKKVRNKIKSALERELVSKKTKKMVTETLDKLITKLLGSRCHWNGGSVHHSQETLRVSVELSENSKCKINNKEITKAECIKILQKILLPLLALPNTHLDHVFEDFKRMIKNKTQSLKDVFTKPFNFVERGPGTKYRVRCSIADADNEGRGNEGRVKGACDDFRLCSRELKEFLADFYEALNETVVSVFTNYGEMYARDVTADGSEETNYTISVIHNASYAAEVRLKKVFMKQVTKLKLDENKQRHINVGAIKEYIKSTVKHTIKNVNKYLETDLGNLRAKILQTIKEDLHINTGVDLGNLESHFLGKVCTFFVTCNGEVSRSLRRRYSRDEKQLSNVYVEVQSTLDVELKEKMVNQDKELVTNTTLGNPTGVKNLGISGKGSNVKVTRTTMSTTRIAHPTSEKYYGTQLLEQVYSSEQDRI